MRTVICTPYYGHIIQHIIRIPTLVAVNLVPTGVPLLMYWDMWLLNWENILTIMMAVLTVSLLMLQR